MSPPERTPQGANTLGVLSFACPDSLIRQVENRATARGLTVSEYMVRLLRDAFFKNEAYESEPNPFAIPQINHPLIQALYRNQHLLESRMALYDFFEAEFPDIIEKMQLTAILIRKTDFNEHVIHDMVTSIIPQPFHQMTLQAILDVYQVTAQKLDKQLSSVDTLKAENQSHPSTK